MSKPKFCGECHKPVSEENRGSWSECFCYDCDIIRMRRLSKQFDALAESAGLPVDKNPFDFEAKAAEFRNERLTSREAR